MTKSIAHKTTKNSLVESLSQQGVKSETEKIGGKFNAEKITYTSPKTGKMVYVLQFNEIVNQILDKEKMTDIWYFDTDFSVTEAGEFIARLTPKKEKKSAVCEHCGTYCFGDCRS